MKKILLIFATLFLMVACSKDDDKPKNPNSFPFLKLGNEWEYGVYDGDTDTLMKTYIEKIVSDVSGIFQVNLITDSTEITSHLFSIQNNYLYFGSSKFLPQNTQLGLKWDDFEILSISETVDVPAGIFHNCIKIENLIEFGDATMTSHWWIHKDIGIIMIESLTFKQRVKLHSKNF